MDDGELVVLAEGEFGIVTVNAKCKEAYDRIQGGTDERSKKRKVQLARYMKGFCSEPRHRLNDQQFKAEGTFPDGLGNDVQVWEFKPWQWRLYGVVVSSISGKRQFVGLNVDEDKKKNKADGEMLKRTAKAAGQLQIYKNGIKKTVVRGKKKR